MNTCQVISFKIFLPLTIISQLGIKIFFMHFFKNVLEREINKIVSIVLHVKITAVFLQNTKTLYFQKIMS